ncbi:MAG: hypothetical protein JXJ17_13790 [Anaerolineae bacterium]|nr:hypothetical protein [Anaerolineae bacterium]
MTRARQGEPLPEKEPVLAQVNAMLNTFEVADETPDVTNWLITPLKQTSTAGKQVHDANVVATMLAYGIDTLLTANIGDFVRFEDKITLMALMGKDI